ncbi:MAG: hypothetical protein JJE52_19025, partial [Acidimicrobiia bacterium]|nr:hypothetical protein [Acidimicrobiia bacterium]
MATPPTPEPLDSTDVAPADEFGALIDDRAAAGSFIADLRAGLLAPPSDEVAASHLAAMFGALDAKGSGAQVVDLTQRRARRTLAGALVAAGALGLTGGFAAAGTLPAPVQDAVSRVANVFAIDLPNSDEVDHDPDDIIVTVDNPSITAPGRTGDNPSDTAPGRTGDNPSDTAPGRTGDNPSDTAPGRTGDNPSD